MMRAPTQSPQPSTAVHKSPRGAKVPRWERDALEASGLSLLLNCVLLPTPRQPTAEPLLPAY